jgi:hypothetical protein
MRRDHSSKSSFPAPTKFVSRKDKRRQEKQERKEKHLAFFQSRNKKEGRENTQNR